MAIPYRPDITPPSDDVYGMYLNFYRHQTRFPTEQDWLSIAPEMAEVIPLKIEERQEERSAILTGAKNRLRAIRHQTKCDEDAYEICSYLLELGTTEDLRHVDRHIGRLKRLLPQTAANQKKRGLSQNEIERARQVALLNIVEADMALRRTGKTWVGLCPFHQEKSPSFTVYPDTNTFYCYGCQEHGDTITYVMKTHHLIFVEALAELNGGAR